MTIHHRPRHATEPGTDQVKTCLTSLSDRRRRRYGIGCSRLPCTGLSLLIVPSPLDSFQSYVAGARAQEPVFNEQEKGSMLKQIFTKC